MTDEQMNAAIAEACGWKREGDPYQSFDDGSMVQCWTNPLTSEVEYKTPDYCNDLNAMHEAEKTIAPVRVPRYISEVWAAMCKGGNVPEMDIGTIHATACQRAEAFLRTVGKWVDQ